MGTIKKERRRYSIFCVAGFRVNMVRSAVAFMEPVLPSAEYPTGVRLMRNLLPMGRVTRASCAASSPVLPMTSCRMTFPSGWSLP